jgi:hypothetical protein
MIVAGSIRFAALGGGVNRLIYRGPSPSRTPRVVINVISPTEGIDPTLPAGG